MPRKSHMEKTDVSNSEGEAQPIKKRKKNNGPTKAKQPRAKKAKTQTNSTEENASTSESNPTSHSEKEKEFGRRNALHRIALLEPLGPYLAKRKNKSDVYMGEFKAAYDELYKDFVGTRDDNDVSQLAFVLGQHDMAKSGYITRKRPTKEEAALNVHWDSYIQGTQSYKDPLSQLELEKEGVGALFLVPSTSPIHEEARNLAVNDYIQGNEKKSSEKLAEINLAPEFVQHYEMTYKEFEKGYTKECESMRRGVVISNLNIADKNSAAYLAGKKYALYEFMHTNHLSQRPNTDYLAKFYGKRDAVQFKLPLKGRLAPEFKQKYDAEYAAALVEMEKCEDARQQNLVRLFKKYISRVENPISKELKQAIKTAQNKAQKDYEKGKAIETNLKKLEEGDPGEIVYQFSYYRKIFRKGERSKEDALMYKATQSARVFAKNGGQAKSQKQISKMRVEKGDEYTETYLKIFSKKKSKMSNEEESYRYYYMKGKNKTYIHVLRQSSGLQHIKFDKNDSLYLLKKEAYLLGLLKGLDTKNEEFDEARKLKLRRQFAQELNVIYQSPGRQVFPGIKQMQERMDVEALSNPISASSVRVDKVAVFNGEKGLFARRIIYPGEFFLEYMGEIKSKEEAETSHYAAELDGNRVKDGAEIGNASKYANHSDNPNAQLVVIGNDVIMIEALEAIEPENQIIINYGPNYPLKNKIGINPCDTGSTSKAIYEKNSTHYLSQPYYFNEKFEKNFGLPARGPYLITALMSAMLEGEDEAFDTALKKEVLELPMLAIEGQNKLLVFSDLHFNYYCNALMLACFIGSITYVTKLLEAGARGNVLQRNNNSLLHLVFQGEGTEEEKIEIALILLKNGVNPFIINNDKVWFFTLIEKGITSNPLKLSVLEKLEPNNALLFACFAKSSELVESLVKKGHGFNLSCLVKGKLYLDFRNEVVNFLKMLSQSDKKLFEALFGYATLRSYDEYSSTNSPAFFKPVTMDISENKLAQHFNGLTQEQFDSLYQFLREKEIFNLYPVIENDLESAKNQFTILPLMSNVTFENLTNSRESSDNEDDLELEKLNELYNSEVDYSFN